jgi:hypothetical protein
MADDVDSAPDRAQARAAAKKRRRKRIGRREAYFDLLASGYSYPQIAEAMKVSCLSVRRAIDRALADRRLDTPDCYIHLQVARLTKALRSADASIEKGDLKAVAPFVRIVAELDRYHVLGVKYQRRLAAPIPGEPAAPPLALTHAASASVTSEPAKVS